MTGRDAAEVRDEQPVVPAPPPFDPDRSLITYLEKGQGSDGSEDRPV